MNEREIQRNKEMVARNTTVSFSDQLLKTRFNELPPETQQALIELAAKNKITFNQKVQEDLLTHQNADLDVDRFLEEARQQRLTGDKYKISNDVKTTTGTMHMEIGNKASSYCYVATATYQNKNHPNVIILRDYRDRFLRKKRVGRLFIYVYYKIGKYLAVLPNHIPVARNISKKILDQITLSIAKRYYL